MTEPFDDMHVIFSYTRAQAIADGVLVDLSPWAKELGFLSSVTCTAAVWQGYIVPPAAMRPLGQCERGRAHDLLFLLLMAIRSHPGSRDQLLYEVAFQQEADRAITVTLKAVCGPGDVGEPVLTVMLESED